MPNTIKPGRVGVEGFRLISLLQCAASNLERIVFARLLGQIAAYLQTTISGSATTPQLKFSSQNSADAQLPGWTPASQHYGPAWTLLAYTRAHGFSACEPNSGLA